MKTFDIILIAAVLTACSPQTRLNRLMARHPELTTVDTLCLRDTLRIPEAKAETVLNLALMRDTVYLQKDRLEVSIQRHRDTLYVRGRCRSDTIIFTRKVPVVKVRYIKPDRLTAVLQRIPWLVAGLIAVCILILFLVNKFAK